MTAVKASSPAARPAAVLSRADLARIAAARGSLLRPRGEPFFLCFQRPQGLWLHLCQARPTGWRVLSAACLTAGQRSA